MGPGGAAALFHTSGLGAVVREIWRDEGINPPRDLGNRGVWDWLNRSDVAASLAIALVPDVRLLIVAAASMARQVVRFLGGVPHEILGRCQLMAYGLEEGNWRAECINLHGEASRLLNAVRVSSGPGGDQYRAVTWQSEAMAATVSVNNATHLLVERAGQQQVRQQIFEASKHSWQGLRAKLRDVDGMDEATARHVANQLLLDELRKVVNPGVFSSVFLWSRRE